MWGRRVSAEAFLRTSAIRNDRVLCEQEGHENGNAFYGTQGRMIFGKHNGWQLFGPRNKLIEEMRGSVSLEAHHRNFLDCIRNGNTPNAKKIDNE